MHALRRFASKSKPASPRFGAACGMSMVIGVMTFGGCAKFTHHGRNAPGSPAPAANVVPPAAGTVSGAPLGEPLGSVHVIGTDGRFVLVEITSNQPISTLVDGQTLICRKGGVVTATVHVSHERRPPFVVADVVAGEAHVGDEVFLDSAPARATINNAPGASPGPVAPPAAAPKPDFHSNPTLPPTR